MPDPASTVAESPVSPYQIPATKAAINPVAYTEAVVADFLRYQLTTYPLADQRLYQQMRNLLSLDESRSTPLRQGPFISLSRPFKQGATIDSLVQEGILHPHMNRIVPYPSLRKHQEDAIRAIRRGRATLVATGTGSGKTESFLYPIISRCLELKDSPAGIVAVILYPMNALAEDQLERLRGLLAGRGISFAMYVGKTPEDEAQVRGERMRKGSSNADYHARMRQIREAGQSISLLPPEERASRAAMRKPGEQPRILLTNVKQLELLLTRDKDVGMFADAPLEFLVFDEAHTFRGAQGAETACLIRRLRAFCGKSAAEVTCVATSATMADPLRGLEAGRDFARRFFGVDRDKVEIVGEAYDEQRWLAAPRLPAGPPQDSSGILARLLRSVELPDPAAALSEALVALGGQALPGRGWQAALSLQLSGNSLVKQLSELLSSPRSLVDLLAPLSETTGWFVSEAEILCWLALGAATGRDGHDPLLRPVIHSFVRGVGGAVVTLADRSGEPRLWLSGKDAARAVGDHVRSFSLLSCTTCGQHYFESWNADFFAGAGPKDQPEGGDRVGSGRQWEHLAEDLGGQRVLFVDRLVVRPEEDEDLEEEEEASSGHDFSHRRLLPLWICNRCGALHAQASSSCTACLAATPPVEIQVVRSKKDNPGVLGACVACRAPGRRPAGGNFREPARPVRAVGVSDVHVLAQSMIHLSERPRLLVFADNRQDAAFQAGWMRDHARRFRLRALMAQQIPPEGASVGDIALGLDGLLECDRDLSRALIPEVWQVVPQEEAGSRHREERLYFLRVQVLRELTTGVKQRLGLEPWGRLKVIYQGLTPDMEWIRSRATALGCPPEQLCEGVAALLDHLRRSRILWDATTKLFNQHWGSENREIQAGYFPPFAGGPRGVMYSRGPDNLPARALQWVGSRPTQMWNAVETWGFSEDQIEPFLEELWSFLRREKFLVPAPLEGWGKALKGSAGVWQVNAGKLLVKPHRGRWRCERCRRTTLRHGPGQSCMAWRCGGRLTWEIDDRDDFDLHTLDQNYALLRVAEHSAQVPHSLRERIENQFKGQGEQLNTLVCTPTLELGVDIGALDAVLMRNVPPTAANYWQRAGRAGRRHRMAVDITYAQATGFDQSYFRDPLKLLRGQVDPPRFNLKNEVMIRKHIHATVLTTLHGLARRHLKTHFDTIHAVLSRCFPPTLRSYLFSPNGSILPQVQDVSELGSLIQNWRAEILEVVQVVYRDAWPAEDREAVQPQQLAAAVDGMANTLQTVLHRFKRRLDWALGELRRLEQVQREKGTLDREDEAHRSRCERMIKRLKGEIRRSRSSAEGGGDDSETMGALAREAFLPGYGLEAGSVVATAVPPRLTEGLDDFEFPRPPVLAVREYVPGNAIYANGLRFVPRRFQLSADEVLRFTVLVEQQVVQEAGSYGGQSSLATREIRAVPICDVGMPAQSHISDEEDFRFQMPVAMYGSDRGFHRGGHAWAWGTIEMHFRRGVQLRLVNVGPRKEVAQGSLGYSLCLACGQSLSPYSSATALQDFVKKHMERCQHPVQPTGFYADVEVDTLALKGVASREVGFSIAESLRMGAAKVLDMEVEDLQLLSLGQPGAEEVDLLLYDPMPGGSGLLEQLLERWEDVRQAALELVLGCPGACERACVDCLQSYRNRFYHEHLNRFCAAEYLGRADLQPVVTHPLPEKLPRIQATTGQAQTHIEAHFQKLVREAGLPDPVCQHTISLGSAGKTIPDFFYASEDEPGICIFLDGMSGQIHGNPEQAGRDRHLRESLRSEGYEVIEVRSFDLEDRKAMTGALARIAKYLMLRERQQAIKNDTSWFDRARGS